MTIFISGGAKSGKSSLAQRAALNLSAGRPRYYVATMVPFDDEDRSRVARHIESRAGMGFTTLELPRAVHRCLDLAPNGGTFLIDSVTALLLNEMYPGDATGPDPNAAQRCAESLLKIAKNAENAVFVSDYIYSDAMRYDDFTAKYRRDLASIDRAIAQTCDTVLELCAGNIIVHKGVWEP